MKGEIAGCERLVIEGQVDATLSEVKTIEVSASGQFKGTAEVETAVIAGVYEGSLKVSGHLEVASTGAIKGSVSYKTIMVANGGKLEGTIELT
jgi:cytoskeletal protein CcmA (bactofilin family)